jgi:hypothetical protein
MVFRIKDTNRADWPLLQNGAVTLYWRMELFEAAIDSLAQLRYRVLRLRFNEPQQFMADVSKALKWQQQFGYQAWGGGLDALNDAFRDEPFNSADDSAFCVENFQAAVKYNSKWSTAMLDIIERTSRDYLLFGKRLVALVQTKNATYRCKGIGATSAHWNKKEWLDRTRKGEISGSG